MNTLRNRDIMYLKGVGPRRAELLKKELDISTWYDLLHHFPTHYVDRSKYVRIADLREGAEQTLVQIKGRFISFNEQGEGAKRRLVAAFTDGSGMMEVVWFRRIKSLRSAYRPGTEYVLFGKPAVYGNRWSMAHPEVDTPESVQAGQGLHGVYPLTEALRDRGGVSSRTFYGWMQTLLSSVPRIGETLPPHVVAENHLMSLDEAIRTVHAPRDTDSLNRARLRLKFEELFFIQLNMQRLFRRRKQAVAGRVFSRIGAYFNNFYSQCLPFELTGAQKRVLREIRADVATGRQMNRLLQGDVGSGKTLVALLTMLMALDNNSQAALMAPTEILATQHFQTIRELVAPIGVNVRLLTGSTPRKARSEIHEQLRSGELHILIGTHALLEDEVQFRDLGMVVIDEQHRFGVAQRARLWTKNAVAPHVLVMTATPIPRTLAMTVYGDLDVSVIDELPPGRKPITTLLRYDDQRFQVYMALGQELRAGRQAYIVYPLIDENEKLDLRSLEEGYQTICDIFNQYRVAYVHGRMKPAEKDYQMQLFASGEAQILVATTVIEVGVNVPNASVMIIENAERFGLSQLHQLRGRVGRGADRSWCILMSKHQIAKDTRKRLEIMTSTTDGFVIAEADMQMRGPGDIEGTMQSGISLPIHIANLATDGQIIQLARTVVDRLLDDDPGLLTDSPKPENAPLLSTLRALFPRQADWSRIS